MPYINAEQVKSIRNALKLHFPKYKFSVRKEHYSTCNITVLSGPVDFTKVERHGQVNPYHYQANDYTDEQKATIALFYKAAQEAHPKHIVSEDCDYGSIPNYYLNLSIGSWNKPYVKV